MTTLAAILATPPLTTGTRTLARLESARELIGADRVLVGNLLAVPTAHVGEITQLGADLEQWVESRPAITECVESADALLLGFGVSSPSGVARRHFQSQVDWLMTLLDEKAAPVYLVGNKPRHPSRWQRWTARAQPGLPFQEALARELRPVATAGAADVLAPQVHRQ